jgi:hypothetical protein
LAQTRPPDGVGHVVAGCLNLHHLCRNRGSEIGAPSYCSFGPRSQMRRSSSLPIDTAEGHGLTTPRSSVSTFDGTLIDAMSLQTPTPEDLPALRLRPTSAGKPMFSETAGPSCRFKITTWFQV